MTFKNQRTRMIFMTLTCFLLFTGMILARRGLSAALPGIVATGIFSRAQLGVVSSAFFVSYALMQLPCGLLADRFSAPLLIIIGAAGTGITSLLFPTARTLAGFTFYWCLNGFFQAFVWPAMIRVLALSVEEPMRTKSVLLVSCTGPVGSLLTYAFQAAFSSYGWEIIFRLSGIFLLVMSGLWVVFSRALIGDAPVYTGNRKKTVIPFAVMKTQYLLCGLPLIVLAAFLHGTLKDGLSTWVPTYLTEVFSMSERSALILSTVLPLVNLAGLFLVRTYVRRSEGNELTGTAFTFILSAAVTAAMVFLFKGSLSGTVVCFALLTSAMQVVNCFIVSLVPMRFSSCGLVASTAGILDAVLYLGSACSGPLFGRVTDFAGWGGTRLLWLGIAVLGSVFSLLAIRRWAAYRASLPAEK